jgi:hypothetical protein
MARKLITGYTPIQEQQIVEAGIIDLANKSENAFSREILRAMKAIARTDDGDMPAVMEIHQTRLHKLLTKLYSVSYNIFGQRMLDSLAEMNIKRDVPMTPYFDTQMALWLRWVAGLRVTQISNTTSTQALDIIRMALEDSVTEGLAERETAALIQQRIAEQGGNLSRLRGRMIARTESHSAANASAEKAVSTVRSGIKKEWISALTERTRLTHLASNGQKVNKGESFLVGTDILLHPGDPNGSAKEIINCRCVVGYSLA